eukprot:jgi/Galph1/2991/GphlegSOOS_G1677.1
MGRRGSSVSGGGRRTPLRNRPSAFTKTNKQEDGLHSNSSARNMSSVAKTNPIKNRNSNNTHNTNKQERSETKPAATAMPGTKPSLTSSMFGGMLGSMLPMFLFMNWFGRGSHEKQQETEEEQTPKKCQKLACNIQTCLQENEYQQNMCEEAIRKYQECMEAAKQSYEGL